MKVASRKSKINGEINFLSPFVIEITTSTPLWVEILVDNIPLGIVRTEPKDRSNVAVFTISSDIAKRSKVVSIRPVNSSSIFAEKSIPKDFGPIGNQIIGEIYHDGGLIVYGWAVDPQYPDKAVRVTARIGEIILASTVADKHPPLLPYLATCPENYRQHGFELRLPMSVLSNAFHNIRITDEFKRDIPGSPIVIRPPEGLSYILQSLSVDKMPLASLIARTYEARLPASAPFESIYEWLSTFIISHYSSIPYQPIPLLKLTDTDKSLPKLPDNYYDYVALATASIKPILPAYTTIMYLYALETSADVVYADSIGITPSITFFRPDWDPFLFESFDYIGSLLLVKKHVLSHVNFSAPVSEIRRQIIEISDRIEHLPIPLYVELNPDVPKPKSIKPLVNKFPHVTIIIPTRDRLDLLEPCVSSILDKTDYPSYDILIIDNNSQTQEMRSYLSNPPSTVISTFSYPYEFNYAAMHNIAIPNVKGDFILLLNNDTEVISSDWLSEMVSLMHLPGVEVVGAKLIWPNNLVQHGGVIVGVGGLAAHVGNTWDRNESGYLARNISVGQWSAVTAACMLISKKTFLSCGGFDDVNFPVNFNDIDLCLRIRKNGGKILWTPYAELYHHESSSRGGNSEAPWKRWRELKEQENFRLKWGSYEDPFYNPNLSLSPFCAPFSALALPPRKRFYFSGSA